MENNLLTKRRISTHHQRMKFYLSKVDQNILNKNII